ncbi:hypothetical protein Cch01nite_43540 [Cellulomonas chitinilytica]|uniref:Tandem-95 repeat protein n=1 Tax=Cellulomonas chitinilytica TaxID=398759 RepID=A0A919U148_9CELL|nr:hypothetical protein Cch01nite_43540 [Cellulomonas chitinilytica]
MAVRSPQGSTVGGGVVRGPEHFFDTMTLLVDGTYTVVVDPREQFTGSLTFLLTSVGLTPVAGPFPLLNQWPALRDRRTRFPAPPQPVSPDRAEVERGGRASRGTPMRFDRSSTPISGLVTETPVDPAAATGTPVDPAAVTAAAVVPSVVTEVVDGRHRLSLTDAELLANDRPGPDDEATQRLTVTGVTATSETHGTLDRTADGTIHYTPEDGFLGQARFAYTVCDDGTTASAADSQCSEGTVSVVVVPNSPPTADDQRVTTVEDTSVPVVLVGADPDEDPVTFVVVRPPAHGRLAGTPPRLTYTPPTDFTGADSFTVAADDGQDLSTPATVSVTITEVNDAPVTSDDVASTTPGAALTFAPTTLTGNDSAGPAAELRQTLTLDEVQASAATHGQVTRRGDGTVTYTPAAGFEGSASFEYVACDDGTTAGEPDPRCSTGRVAVDVRADAPPTAVPQTVTVPAGAPTDVVLRGSDPEGDTLTFAVTSPPAHGTLTGTPPALVYTPESGFAGTDAFTFTVSDARSTSAPVTVTLVVVPGVPPVIGPDSAVVSPGGSVLIDVLANDTATAGLDPGTLEVTVAPERGTATVENGAVRYTAAAEGTDPAVFGYRVCDTLGVCGEGTVQVRVQGPNRPPAAADDEYAVDVDGTLTVPAPGVLANDADPDANDAVHVRLVTGVGAGNLLLDGSGAFTYTPAPDYAGHDSFTYRVVDRAGESSPPATVRLAITLDGLLAGDDSYSVTRDNALTVPAPGVLANDVDTRSSGVLTATIESGPQRGTVALSADGSVDYTPDPGYVGPDSFTYTTTTVAGVTSLPARVALAVTEPPGPVPSISGLSPADGGRVTGPVPVTARFAPPAGQTLDRWAVWVRNVDDGTPTILAEGDGAPPTELGTFDPTTVANGTYQIRVEVTATGGGASTATSTVVVAGDMKLGDYATTYLDTEAMLGGIPVQILRTYDTTDRSRGDFGTGWRLELSSYHAAPNGRLGQGGWFTEAAGFPFTQLQFRSTVAHYVTVTSPHGGVEVFDLTPEPSSPLLGLTTPAYTARPGTGTTSTLEDVDSPVLALGARSLRGFLTGEVYDPEVFRLTTKDGTVLLIDRYDGVRSITDRLDNQLVLDETGVHSEGAAIAIDRDGAGRVTALVGPSGERTGYTYDAAGNLGTFTARNGAVDRFTYDDRHRLLAVDGPGGLRLRTLTYGPDGRLATITDGAGNTQDVSSDVDGRQEVTTSASGRLNTIRTYGTDGLIAAEQRVGDGETRTTRYEYDAETRLTRVTSPMGRTTELGYDTASNLITYRNALGETWTFAYDDLNLRTRSTSPGGVVVESATYDPDTGVPLTTTERGGLVTTYHYDADGQVTSVDDDRGTTAYTWDAAGNVETVTDAAGAVTSYTYDPSGNVATVTTFDGRTRYERGSTGDVTAIVAPDGSTRRFDYDASGRLKTETDPAGRSTGYTYDRAGDVESVTARTGDVTSYDYDADGFLTSVTFAGGAATTIDNDAFGRRHAVTDADSVVVLGYDDDDNLVEERTTGNGGDGRPDVTLSYAHDAASRLTGLTGPGGTVTYGYDAAGLLDELVDTQGGTFGLTYDSAGRLDELARPNGVDDDLRYEPRGLLARVATSPDGVVQSTEYTFDGLGRRGTSTDGQGTHSYEYDPADRLVTATHPAASGLPDEAFTYDAVGDRTSWAGSPAATVTYDTGNRLTSDGTYDYAWDAEGRLVSRQERASGDTTTYRWDGAGLLVGIDHPDGTVSTYRYDGLGRRTEVDEGGTVRRYVYDGWNIHLEYDGTDTLRATYTTGLATGEIYSVTRDGATTYPLVDGLGSVVAWTDADGGVVGRTSYDAFGNSSASGTVDDTYAYTGYQQDASGLFYARFRYYDPAVGRFLSEDPELNLNVYAYAENCPTQYIDPLGRQATSERITIECKSTFNAIDAARKINALKKASKAGLLVRSAGRANTAVRKAAGAAQAAFRKGLPAGVDADHIIELVLGGAADALWPLDASTNRSIGAQIGAAVRKIPIGTRITIATVNC